MSKMLGLTFLNWTDALKLIMCVCVHTKLLQLCLSLCDPKNHSSPGFLVHGILRQEYWSGFPCPPPDDAPNPEIEPQFLRCPALAGGFFTTSTT